MTADRLVDPIHCPSSVYDPHRLAAAAGRENTLWNNVPSWPRVGGQRRVIVIGGGIAGLCAALSLRSAGFCPIVLERTSRTGGRFFTLRDHFDDQYVELGVTRLPETHKLPLAYARAFGLPLFEYPSEGLRQIYHVLGKRFVSSLEGGTEYPDDFPLGPDERSVDAERLHDMIMEKATTSVGNPRDSAWPPQDVRQSLGGVTFSRYLDQLGLSQGAREIIRSYDGSEGDALSALGWLAMHRLDHDWRRSYAISGGNDRLTSAFAAALGDLVLTDAHVQRIAVTRSGVSVGFLHRGRLESVEAELVVCAVPHRCLPEIVFDPPLSRSKRTAAADLAMIRATRLNFQFDRRFWGQDEGVRGLLVACTTTPIERLWDLTAMQQGTRGILTAYIQHRNAEDIDQLPSDELRLMYGLNHLETIFPNARPLYHKGLSFSWQQPWTHGAWPAMLPHQTDLVAALQRAEGPIYFAGDHTSLHMGWAQGALESAHFAVAELIADCHAEARVAS